MSYKKWLNTRIRRAMLKPLGVFLFACFALASCGREGVNVTEKSSAPDPLSNPESLQDPCTYDVWEDGEFVSREAIQDPVPVEVFLYDLEWVDVKSLERVRVDPRDGATIARITGSSEKSREFDEELEIDRSVNVASEAALAEDSKVRIGVSVPGAKGERFATVAIVERNGTAMLVGNCVRTIILNQLEESIGVEEAGKAVANLPELYRSGRFEELMTPKPAEQVDDPLVLLNPAEVDQEFLDSLDEALLVVTTDGSIPSGHLICAQATAGWNDCWPTDDPRLSNDGLVMELFLDSDGILDIWLVPADVDLRAPDGFIGSIRLDPTELQTSDLLVAKATVSAASGQNGTVTLEAVSDITDIGKDDDRWAALGDLQAVEADQEGAE